MLLAALEHASAGNGQVDVEHRIVRPDGELRHVHQRARLLGDDAGQPLLSGVVHDITESKMTKKKLQHSETLLQIASRMAHIGGWEIELSEGRVEWSDEVCAIHEVAPCASISLEQAISFYDPENSHEKINDVLSRCIRDGTPFDEELQIITAKGRRIWVRASGQAVRDASGAITRIHGAIQDITEKKQSEQDALRLARRLTITLESITDAFVTLDREWRFTYLNREAEHLLQRTQAELLGKVLWDEYREAVGGIFDRQYHRAVREQRPIEFEEFHPELGLWLEVHAYPSEQGLALYLRDITERKRAQEALRESEERFKNVAKVTSDVIWDWDLQSGNTWWNEGFYALFGYLAEDIEPGSESWSTRIHPEDRERVLRSVHALLEGPGEHWNGEYRFLRKDGSFAYVLDRGSVIRDAGGKAVRMIGAMSDLSQRKQAEEEKQRADARIREQASMLDKAQDAIVVRGIDHRILFWNKGAERLYGWTAKEALGRSITELAYGDPAAFNEATGKVLERGEWSGEILQRHKDSRSIMVEGHWTLVRDDDGKPKSILSINTDITQRKTVEQKIQRLAFYDPLTGLPNRLFLLDRLQHALATSARSRHMGAVMFIDLDNFKALNDTLGHDKGDMLLQQVARRLTNCVRESDTVGRLGGDEFVVMLEELGENAREAAIQAKKAGEKILACFNQVFRLGETEHYSTPSIGITLFKGHQDSIDEILKRADLAMYQAKAAGRNAMRFFDPEMQAAVTSRVTLESDLREGSRQNQFRLYYQPQVEGKNHLTGAEALVRWQHPRRGLVSPAEFIPLAEETGLILSIGQSVLETACRQLAIWATRPETAYLNLAVNVSVGQFRHPDFVEQVLAVLDRTGADPRKLKLELTESLLVADMEVTIAKMAALKAKGVSFSLDDFGTGYSSLAYLKRLPLDQLKIDQSFVRDVLTDPNDATIARAIVALGRNLGLAVIAEGVETEAQQDFLAHNGCHAYQGFLFNRPLPIDEFEVLTRTKR